MSDKKPYEDHIYEKLLAQYERPSLDAEGIEALSSLFLSGRVRRFPVRFLRGFSIAAGVVVLVSAVFFFALWQSGLPSPYRIAGGPASSTPGLVTSDGNTVALLTDNESVTLAPFSRLAISGDPLRRLSGNNGNRYRLEEGSVYIDHKKSSPVFTLETAWGTIRPLGTILQCTLTEDGLELSCLQDSLSFTTAGNTVYLVVAGSTLTVENYGQTITVRPMETSEEPAALPVPQNAPGREKTGAANSPLWSQLLAGTPERMHLGDEVSVIAYPDRLVSISMNDGSSIATATMEDIPALSEMEGDSIIVYSAGVLRSYGIPGLEKSWETETGTIAFSSFSVSAGKLFLPSADGNLYVHDAETGSLLRKIGNGAGLYGTPLVSGNVVYFSTLDRKISAVNHTDGSHLWEYVSERRFVDDRPTLAGDTLLVYGNDGSFIALDRNDGRLLWTAVYEKTMRIKPVAWNSQFVFSDEGGLKILSPVGEGDTAQPDLLPLQNVLDIQPFGDTMLFADSEGFGTLAAGLPVENLRLIPGKIVLARIGKKYLLAADGTNLLSCYQIPQLPEK